MAKTPPIPVRVAVDVTVSAGITHLCPPEGSGTMPCCGRTPFEVPGKHRMTLDERLVTCGIDAPLPKVTTTDREQSDG